MNEAALLKKVNHILEKDITHQTLFSTIGDLVTVVEQLQEENNLMAEKHADKDIAMREMMGIIEEQKSNLKGLRMLLKVSSKPSEKNQPIPISIPKFFDADDQH